MHGNDDISPLLEPFQEDKEKGGGELVKVPIDVVHAGKPNCGPFTFKFSYMFSGQDKGAHKLVALRAGRAR